MAWETFPQAFRPIAPERSRVALILAPLRLRDRHRHSGTEAVVRHAAICSASRTEHALARYSFTRIFLPAAPSSGGSARWQTWNLSRLYLRRSPLGRRFTMVDAASKATPSPLRAPRRAPDEKCLLTVDVDEKSCTCPCVPDVLCWEL